MGRNILLKSNSDEGVISKSIDYVLWSYLFLINKAESRSYPVWPGFPSRNARSSLSKNGGKWMSLKNAPGRNRLCPSTRQWSAKTKGERQDDFVPCSAITSASTECMTNEGVSVSFINFAVSLAVDGTTLTNSRQPREWRHTHFSLFPASLIVPRFILAIFLKCLNTCGLRNDSENGNMSRLGNCKDTPKVGAARRSVTGQQ